MNITKRELLRLHAGLVAVGPLTGVRFPYAVVKSMRALSKEVEALKAAAKRSDAFLEFEQARWQLCEEHAKRDADGPVMVDGNYQFADPKRFQRAFKKLTMKHTDAWVAREKQMEEYEALLDEEAEVTLHQVDVDDLPDDITSAQLNAIFEIVSENGVT